MPENYFIPAANCDHRVQRRFLDLSAQLCTENTCSAPFHPDEKWGIQGGRQYSVASFRAVGSLIKLSVYTYRLKSFPHDCQRVPIDLY